MWKESVDTQEYEPYRQKSMDMDVHESEDESSSVPNAVGFLDCLNPLSSATDGAREWVSQVLGNRSGDGGRKRRAVHYGVVQELLQPEA